MKLEFKSASELYERIKPALKTKKNEMERLGFAYIREEDIWNYLKEVKWHKSKNLSLADIVSDILNADNSAIDDYLKTKFYSRNRRIYFDEE